MSCHPINVLSSWLRNSLPPSPHHWSTTLIKARVTRSDTWQRNVASNGSGELGSSANFWIVAPLNVTEALTLYQSTRCLYVSPRGNIQDGSHSKTAGHNFKLLIVNNVNKWGKQKWCAFRYCLCVFLQRLRNIRISDLQADIWALQQPNMQQNC
jgi:hypothetical protein